MAVLLFFTNAREESLLVRGEKRIELNGVRSDLHPDHTPLLHKHDPPLAWEEGATLPLFLEGESLGT